MTGAGSQQTLNRAIICSVTKNTEGEEVGNGKRNATFYSARTSEEGSRENQSVGSKRQSRGIRSPGQVELLSGKSMSLVKWEAKQIGQQ